MKQKFASIAVALFTVNLITYFYLQVTIPSPKKFELKKSDLQILKVSFCSVKYCNNTNSLVILYNYGPVVRSMWCFMDWQKWYWLRPVHKTPHWPKQRSIIVLLYVVWGYPRKGRLKMSETFRETLKVHPDTKFLANLREDNPVQHRCNIQNHSTCLCD